MAHPTSSHPYNLDRIRIPLLVACGLAFPGLLPGQSSTPPPAEQQGEETQGEEEQQGDPEEDLGDLSLEELMDVEITSAAKKEQKLSSAMGAVFVLTNEDIRRRGVTTIPDALRTVPGVQVARINGSIFSITARGFGGRFSNKLLVMIDGRTVYSPSYSGVYWDAKDVMLEDVERIEVVRGPGGALWGLNAVNGVINIITKSSAKTQGGFASMTVGTEEQVAGASRYGFTIDKKTSARIYAKYFKRDGQLNSAGMDLNDDWSMLRTGFRLDRAIDDDTSFTLQGDVYSGKSTSTHSRPLFAAPYTINEENNADFRGGNLLGRWQSTSASGVNSNYQVFYDYVQREDGFEGGSRQHVLDLESQWRTPIMEHHELMAGLGYRRTEIEVQRSQFISGDTEETDQVLSGFLRGEIQLHTDLTVALGVKVQLNDYTGLETQPDARLRWRAAENHTIWGSYSRAARVPSRVENDFVVTIGSQPGPGGLAVHPEISGNRNLSSETVHATEIGYRYHPAEGIQIDVATFYNEYENLVTAALAGTPFFDPTGPRLVQPLTFDNTASAETFGVEVAAQSRLTSSLHASASYSFMRVHMRSRDVSRQLDGWDDPEGDHPQHQASFALNYDVTDALQLDSTWMYVDRLSADNIPSYLRWDLRLGWRPTPTSDLSIVLQNILDDRHLEAASGFLEQPTQTQRSVLLRFSTSF